MYLCLPTVSVLVLLTGCLAGKIAAPKFKEINPKYLEIPLGQKCKLRCPVSGNPKPEVEWFKQSANGTFEPVSNTSAAAFISRNNNLHIDNFTESDEGIYMCKVSNSLGTISNNFTVKIAEPYLEDAPVRRSHEMHNSGREESNFAPYFTGEMSEFVARPAGSTAILKCPSNGKPWPSVHWLHNGTPMSSKFSRKFDKEVVFRKFSLIMDHVGSYDSGNYTCVIKNSVGSVNFTFRLDVQERIPHRPLFQDSPANQTVEVGGTARFECTFVSDLQPRILWLRHFKMNGSYSDQSELPYVEPVEMNDTDPYILTIENVGFDDEGFYTCLAANAIGVSYRSAFLKVVTKESERAVAKERKSFILEPEHLSLLVVIFVLALLIISVAGCVVLFRCRYVKKKIDETENIVLTKKVILERPQTGNMNSLSIPVVKIDYQMVCRPPPAKKEFMEFECFPEYELPLDPKYEFNRQNLKLGKLLGQGAFAQVRRGEVGGFPMMNSEKQQNKGKAEVNQTDLSSTVVAVKMLKEAHTDADMTMLVKELELMKVISEKKHRNVLNLLGCCSKGGPLYLIVEYCEKGNLRDYLRAHRNNSFAGYEEPIGAKNSSPNLTLMNLIRYAYQVARGMEYLASLKFIHRDLAARNILLTDDDVIKISDFGLAREIESDYYKKHGNNGKLPVKWMSPEAISDRIYSEKSDIWSFGVLLFEIFTLGATPYPGIPYEKLYEQLKIGHRMTKPDKCPMQIYLLMRQCWKDEPSERPTFSEVVTAVDGILLDSLETVYLELNLPVLSTPENSSSGEES